MWGGLFFYGGQVNEFVPADLVHLNVFQYVFFKASDVHVTRVQIRSPNIKKVLQHVTETSKQSPDSVQHVLQPACSSAAWPSHHCPALVMHNDVFWSVTYSTNCQMLRLHAKPAVSVSLAFFQLYKSASFRNLSSLHNSSFSGQAHQNFRFADLLFVPHVFHTHFVSSDLFCVWTHNNN